jgi:hypothetical protein
VKRKYTCYLSNTDVFEGRCWEKEGGLSPCPLRRLCGAERIAPFVLLLKKKYVERDRILRVVNMRPNPICSSNACQFNR